MVDIQTDYGGIIIRLRSENESANFPGIIKEALAKIASRPLGADLLSGIAGMATKAKFGYTISIMRPANMGFQNGNWCMANLAKRINEIDAQTKGVGSNTNIYFNANIVITPDGARPVFIGLAHELIHAYYNLKGKGLNGSIEELATVGLNGHGRRITENGIRVEHGIKPRGAYT